MGAAFAVDSSLTAPWSDADRLRNDYRRAQLIINEMQKAKRPDDRLLKKLFGKNAIEEPEDPIALIARLLVDQIEETLPATSRSLHRKPRRSK